ncbi:MAG: AmmeMemoRadiSam system radical SAM enzyme [Bacteroidales bacterium]|nr:MAG: AmmeMemoRadiSam system radical SAM enzyme [Bacteroidales bacterium]
MTQSQFFKTNEDGTLSCLLCPHECTLHNDQRGNCGVRINRNGDLYPDNYGKVSALHFDPIEKKPLYHFFPGSQILSVGTFGCNLRCRFCQNYEISQAKAESFHRVSQYLPDELIQMAKSRRDNIGISFTYNEPTVWYEYMYDIARLSKQNNFYTAMVTNGFINKAPLEKLLPYMDAFNVDLKAFTEDFYRKYTSSRLDPVLESIARIRKAGKHLEITNLIIPGLNDDKKIFEKMIRWILNQTGKDTVLHLSRYFPMYKMTIRSTPVDTLEKLYHIARKYLNYVFFGNVGIDGMGKNTLCPDCGNIIIIREGYHTSKPGLGAGGTCSRCQKKIIHFC